MMTMITATISLEEVESCGAVATFRGTNGVKAAEQFEAFYGHPPDKVFVMQERLTFRVCYAGPVTEQEIDEKGLPTI